jgi:hypothetical protein
MNADQKHPGNIYTCPMHPEVTGNKGCKCYKCGMTLIAVDTDGNNMYKVTVTAEPKHIEAGRPTNLCIAITERGRNVPLEVVHEKKMHLLIVNEELSWFDHIHPLEQPDGSYQISETFPTAGGYLLFTDYKPVGGSQDGHMHRIEVSGVIATPLKDLETKLVSTVDGYTVSLLNGNNLRTGTPQGLQFYMMKDGHVLLKKDMQPYLGAVAHIVMISKADYDFLHIHPVSDNRFPIYAETNIEKTGLHRIWVQFKTDNVVHTADFTVNVLKGEPPEMSNSKADHH